MVSFVCDACGQTVKKQKVEKHYQSECRSCSVLSCIDCGKDFPGDSYISHTSCITEAEKYQGKLYKAKDKSNKGERKQQEWLEQVRTVSGETEKKDPHVRKLLAKITSYDNVPRKEAKFKKFCENSINVRDSNVLEKLWQVFSDVKNLNPSTNANDVHQNETEGLQDDKKGCVEDGVLGENGIKTVTNAKDTDASHDSNKKQKVNKKQKLESKEKKRKKRKLDIETEVKENGIQERIKDDFGKKNKKKAKRKREEETVNLLTDCPKLQEDEDEKEVVEAKEKFNWESIIKKLLNSAPDHEMPVKKLRRKVLGEFLECGGDPRSRTEQELRVLFEKKLHKNPKVKVVKERAKLYK